MYGKLYPRGRSRAGRLTVQFCSRVPSTDLGRTARRC